LEAATAVPAVAHAPKDAVVTLTLVPRPAKILCIGQNYLAHIEETGATPPEYPTVFAKYARALIGDGDPIVLPAVSAKVDWEVELVAVIGREVRNAGPEEAAAAIAGFTVGNDVSARDLQGRTSQWLQGKTCESTAPVGPCMTTTDEIGAEPDLAISCAVDGVVRQQSRTSDLLFKPIALVSYISQILTLDPGDLIFTGTPGGVGQGLVPPVFLSAGQTVTSSIEAIGTLVNRCRTA
jgi:acylpyruvate hydrolase